MTRVSLVNPIFENMGMPPLGLAYMAAYLEKFGVKVRIVDTAFERLDGLLEDMPRVVGVYSMTPYYHNLVRVIRFVREHNPNVIIVVGGPHATVQPVETLKIPGVNYVVIGEGEITFLELVKTLAEEKNVKGIRGVGLTRKGKIQINPPRRPTDNLDELPFPARHLLTMKKYLKPFLLIDFNFLPIKATTMIASRGCPFNCIFCQPALKKIFGVKVRYRSPGNVLDEMRLLREEYGVEGVLFVDDTFTFSKDWVKAFCKNLQKKKLGLKLVVNSRVDTVDESVLQEMRKAGFIGICFGIESGNQQILNNLGKGVTISQIEKTVRKAKEAGFFVKGFFMIGSPGDTEETIGQTINFAKRLPLDQVQFSITTPYPGTKLYETAVENGWIENMEAMKTAGYFSSAVMRTDSLTSNRIKTIYKTQCKPLVVKKQIVSCYRMIPKILMRPSYIPYLLQVRRLMKYLAS